MSAAPDRTPTGDRSPDGPLPTTKLPDDNNRPLSLISPSNYAAEILAAAHKRQRSLATEILGPNHRLVFPSPAASEVDSQDLGRLSSVSELSEQPASLSKDAVANPLPSPLTAHPPQSPNGLPSFGSRIEEKINLPAPGSESLSFTMKGGPDREAQPSLTRKKVPKGRVSTFAEDLEGVFGDSKILDGDRWTSKDPSKAAKEVTRTHAASPVPETETPNTFIELRKRAFSHATVISPQAKKGSKVNILPRFLRVKSPENNTRPSSGAFVGELQPKESEQQSPREDAVSPQSFFDDKSSDGGGNAQIEDAQQAVIASPVIVKNGSATKVGLKEMLRSTPPADEHTIGQQTVRLLDHTSDSLDAYNESNDAYHFTEDLDNDASSPGLWNEINPFQPAAHKPAESTRKPAPPNKPRTSRKVSFPLPAQLDIQPGHLFLRQSIVSTPYPTSNSDGEQRERDHTVPIRSGQGENQQHGGLEAVITLAIHGNSNTTPKIKRIVIPNGVSKVTHPNSNEKPNPSTKNTASQPPFDDEKLFKLIKKEFSSLHGSPLRRLLSARTVRRVTFQTYHSTSQLLTTPLPFPNADNDHIPLNPLPQHQPSIPPPPLILFHSPRRGHASHTYTTFINSHINLPSPTSPKSPAHLMLSLHTALSPTRLSLAFATVLVLSAATTLLWVFFGTSTQRDSGSMLLKNAFGVVGPIDGMGGDWRGGGGGGGGGGGRYKGAGERVGSGGILGLLVLGLGWTGVGGWVVVSWLVG